MYIGVYAGSTSQKYVRQAVEDSDCLLMFGVMVTDMTLAFRPAKFEKRQVVSCSVEGLKVKNHTFTDIEFEEFCTLLFKQEIREPCTEEIIPVYKEKIAFVPKKEKITTKRFFEKINSILNENTVVVADIGDCLFGAIDCQVPNRNSFISPAFYTSMGFAIPAALGVQTAKPNCRPIVLVGDGSFQMSCNELSTIVSRDLNPIVFVLNNHGYTTERFLMDGSFNDIPNWNYHEFTYGGKGWKVETEIDLENAVIDALKNKTLSVINVIVDSKDVSPALLRMTEGLSKKI